jgi:hypothetical protein
VHLLSRDGHCWGSLNHDPLDLIEADLIAPTIAKLRCTRRGMVCHRRGLFECATILEIGGDSGCRKLWLPSLVAMPVAAARLRIIAWAFACGSGVRVSLAVPWPMVRNGGPLGSSRRPARRCGKPNVQMTLGPVNRAGDAPFHSSIAPRL